MNQFQDFGVSLSAIKILECSWTQILNITSYMEQEPIQELPQDRLKKQLVSQYISPEEFLKKVFELDQFTPSRDQSLENLKILEDASIQEIFEKNDIKSPYKNLLSLTQFHIGQLCAELNTEESLRHFEAALAAAQEVDWTDYEDWKLYIEATVAYFKLDTQKLEEMYPKMEEGRNKVIVKNLMEGLKKRGVVDYHTDYSK